MDRLDPEAVEALKKLKRFFEEKKIPCVLIGAIVPVLLIDLASEDGPTFGSRETKDIDYVAEIADWDDYDILLKELGQMSFLPKDGEPRHRLYSGEIQIDVIPFSSALAPGAKLTWPDEGREMNVACYEDLFSNIIEVEIDKGLTVPVAPLPLFVALKILCYLDRKFPRDLRDVAYVLEHYEESSPRRFEIGATAENLSFETAGAYLLGKDLASVVSSKETIREIVDFLNSIDDIYAEPVSRIMSEEKTYLGDEKRRQELLELFKAFALGLGGA